MAENEVKQGRREFLVGFGIIGTVVIAIGTFAINVFAFLFPSKREKSYHKYLVAKKGEIPVGKAKEITLSNKPVFVVHLENGYKVFSGVCTHLGCIVRWEEQKSRFFCPCHAGFFSKSGEVIGGPPSKPLDEYEVMIENNLIFIKIEDKMEGPWT